MTTTQSTGAGPLQRQLPPGVKDLFGSAARRLVRLSGALNALFARWGYAPVLPPIFEYYDNLVAGYGPEHAAELYRLVDPQGQLLALRPDLTVPIARIVATKLADAPLPLRFSYVAPVFRYVEPQAGRQREFWQAGAELIGAASADADAEMIALLVATLDEGLGLERFQINLGHMGFLRAILAETDVSPLEWALIQRAIDRKNRRSLEHELTAAGLDGPPADALLALPELWGGPQVLDRADHLTPNREAAHAIARLRAVYERLVAYGLGERITLDLGEVRGMDYYTGVTFETFAPGSGYAIASGGRYDDLLAQFGAERPAVGFAVQLERAMLVLEQEQGSEPVPPPDALAEACGHPECLAPIIQRRAQGQTIELDVLNHSPAELRAAAARRGIPEVLVCLRSGESGA
ncbi:MAG: ATP phosphoribosyltransferase regulatory subunit [Ardenticatenaceae bacterium]|nr:ATP phosphoribosyltransferase regulatory subunit [Ardenticatenaceae bacterium]HBY95273.1 ATP phosphoribosyltransferase regulatory subunit [Chloroflexota bacterium]